MTWYIVERIHTLNGNYVVRFIIDGVQAENDSVAMACAVRRNGWKTNESLTVVKCYSRNGRATARIMNARRTEDLQELLELCGV
jgi:hypothetical protein